MASFLIDAFGAFYHFHCFKGPNYLPQVIFKKDLSGKYKKLVIETTEITQEVIHLYNIQVCQFIFLNGGIYGGGRGPCQFFG